MRVHEIAKVTGTASPFVIMRLLRIGIKVKSASSKVKMMPLEQEAFISHVRKMAEKG